MGEHRVAGLLGHQVGVDVRARHRPGGGGRADLGRQIGDVARHPHARHLGHPGETRRDVLARAARVLDRGQAQLREEARPRDHPRCDDQRGQGHQATVGHPHPRQAVVDDLQARHRAVDHRDAPRGELLGMLVGERRALQEVGDVLAQLAEEQRLVHRHRAARQHPDGLVAHLPAVAVRAVQHLAAPPLAQPRHVRQLVGEAGRHQEAAGPHPAAVGQGHGEPVADLLRPGHLAGLDPTAVAAHLRAPRREQLAGRRALAPQQAVHAGGRGVARRTRVDDQHRPARPRQHERSVQPGGTAADHHYVISLVHAVHGASDSAFMAKIFAVLANWRHGREI